MLIIHLYYDKVHQLKFELSQIVNIIKPNEVKINGMLFFLNI